MGFVGSEFGCLHPYTLFWTFAPHTSKLKNCMLVAVFIDVHFFILYDVLLPTVKKKHKK